MRLTITGSVVFLVMPMMTSLFGTEAYIPTPSLRMPLLPLLRNNAFSHHHHTRNINININININTSKTSSSSRMRLFAAKSDANSSLMDNFADTASKQITATQAVGQSNIQRTKFQLLTLIRVGIPSIISGIAAFYAFPAMALFLASIVNDAGVFAVLSQDSSQFVQNFLTVSGLLFSILIGQTYAFLYAQQEAVFYALFNEVTEAKSLLEQVALVCQGRSMYTRVLESISKYVQNDLKQLQADPAVLISARPIDDPLESIMYMTSVGVPSSVYDTVRSLRQARAARLGALQRKLPPVHMALLWILAVIELGSFPLLGAGTQSIGGYNILTVEGVLFGVMTFGIVLTMRVIGELYRPGGGELCCAVLCCLFYVRLEIISVFIDLRIGRSVKGIICWKSLFLLVT
uniref:Uncharacterized protein n=1 Tax=Chaetoceros debilis TaxID=122233 RepID=A0A6S8U768_9STRA